MLIKLYHYSMRPSLLSIIILLVFAMVPTLHQHALAHTRHIQAPFLKKGRKTLPQGCTNDGKTDYPGAIDCILNPHIHDCIPLPDNSPLPCSYNSANRPYDFAIKQIVIHDIEGPAINAINTFQARNAQVSSHYVVDRDGTVYQIAREKDICFQAGNMWYNNHSIGIEHAGYDATGFQWYNAAQYLASAKLVAYLLYKYNLPLDHNHIMSHGTIPSPTLATTPNHSDPGPYWLWDYYEKLIEQQGFSRRVVRRQEHTITIHPRSGQRPFGRGGTETSANFNFFYLHSGPSTATSLIFGNSNDVTDERTNIESDITYYYTQKTLDPAGSGKMLYQIWFGAEDPASPIAHFAHARQVWLAIAPQDVVEDEGTGKAVMLASTNGKPIPIFGRPTTDSQYCIGDAPSGSIFISAMSVIEDNATTLWYEINYNHRQAWVSTSRQANSCSQ